MTDGTRVPSGRLGRLAQLAGAGLRTGASLVGVGDPSRAAEQVADALGTLRGLAAKVGQMASYVDGVVPEPQRDAYQGALKVLRTAAPASAPAAIRRLIEQELGAPLDKLFARFEHQPLASASIGQVHRAWREDGHAVAVKVQHPGIVKALESDLSNAGVLGALLGSVAGSRFQVKESLDVVRQRFREELDYRLEARRVELFRGFHAGDATIRIPAVHGDRTTSRVLTTDFVDGMGFEDACRAEPRLRRSWAETAWRFVFKGSLVHLYFNADPHPGNYVFHADGTMSFLDFGCVQELTESKAVNARAIHQASIQGQDRVLQEHVFHMIEMRPGRLRDMAVEYMRHCMWPLSRAPFRVTRPYAAELVKEMLDMATYARSLPDTEFFTMPTDQLFMNRLQFGFYSVLARLDVEADYAAVERAFLPGLAG